MENRCWNCDFWATEAARVPELDAPGLCQRHSPQIFEGVSTAWPTTDGFDGCGDFKEFTGDFEDPV